VRVSIVGLYIVVSGLAHLVAARWALRVFPALRTARRRRAVIAAAVFLGLLPTLARALTWTTHSQIATTFFAAAMIETIAMALAAVPTAIVGLLAKRRVLLPEATPAASSVGRREALERIVGGTAFGAASAALGWGVVRGRHAFVLEEVVVRVPGWPRALEGYTIAQVSDIHVGAFVGPRELDEGLALVTRAKPDLVVATGDLVDFVAETVDPLAARLAGLSARDGVVAILGNHDHYAGAADVASRVRAAGLRLLVNDGMHLRAGDGGGFALLGVDDLQGRSRRTRGFAGPDLGAALAKVRQDLPRVLLAHNPAYLSESNGRVALQLSGHTHGGQINPGFCPASLFLRYVSGRYELGGTTMWVNRGFGVAGPPSRIAAPPEVTKIVIVGG
jgi:uncharacterized protein